MIGPWSGVSPAGWLVETTIASTLLMLVVLALRRHVGAAFGPQVGYALWVLPVLRLVLPPLPAGWARAVATPISRAGETITYIVDVGGDAAAAPSLAMRIAPTLGVGVAIAWGVGAIGFLAWHLANHTRFCRRVIGSGATLDIVAGITVIASTAAPGPIAFGIVRRYVAFPIDFADRYDADERALALAHEIGHHQRGDLIANWVALAVLAFHWCNPVAWRAFRAFRADQELANDARVLAGRSAIDRHTYACAILKAAHGGAVSAACHLHTIDDLKGRLRMLSTSRRSRRRLATGSVFVSTFVVAGLGLTVSGTSAAAALGGRVGDAIGIAIQAPPAPPVPPAPVVTAVSPAAPAARPRRVVVKRVAKDGSISTYTSGRDGTFDDRAIQVMVDRSLAATPQVRSRRCADGTDGDPGQTVVRSEAGGRHVMVICTNRIAAMTADATRTAANAGAIRRNALATALASLAASRADVAANTEIPQADRARALADMDAAAAEVRAEAATDRD